MSDKRLRQITKITVDIQRKDPANTMFAGFFLLAERVGFEPTDGCPSTDFESVPL